MYLAPSPASADCDYPSQRSSPPSRSTKFLAAGVAMATASVIAVNPATATAATTAAPDARTAAVELSAFANPITEWQKTFGNAFTSLGALGTGVANASNDVAHALGNPAVQAQFAGIFTGMNPQRIQNTLGALPGFADRLGTAGAGFATQLGEALTALPGVLQLSAGFLAQGRFLEAFSEFNLWFLTAGLSDFRGSMLDAFRVPGDLLDAMGLEPLARILGTSWMVTSAPGAQIAGPGLLSRAVIGNLARALLGPPVTAMFQTVEILDALGAAVQAGDIETAVSELVNAPARIANAFFNGYIPAFIGDPDGPFPPGPGQTFPGLFSTTGTFDFFFRQVPEEIAKALQFPRPAAVPAPADIATSEADATQAAESPSGIPLSDSVLVSLKSPAAEVEAAPVVSDGATLEDSTDPTTAPTPEIEDDASVPLDETDDVPTTGEADDTTGSTDTDSTVDDADDATETADDADSEAPQEKKTRGGSKRGITGGTASNKSPASDTSSDKSSDSGKSNDKSSDSDD